MLERLLWRSALPSCSSQQRSPSLSLSLSLSLPLSVSLSVSLSLSLLGGRGMSWENKLQTPYGTSSPCISWVSPRLLVSFVRNSPRVELRLFFSLLLRPAPTGVLRRSLRTVPPGATGNITDQHYCDFSSSFFFLSNGGSGLHQWEPNADSTLNGPAVMY